MVRNRDDVRTTRRKCAVTRRARMRLVHYPDDLDLDAVTIEPLRQGTLYAV